MFEGLDTVNWGSLRHAHGSAADVPDLLRSLLSEDAEEWMQACAELHETIWHQGTVYSASAAAVPFLLELLTPPRRHEPESDVSAEGCAVSLLCAIATGTGGIQEGIRLDGEVKMRARLAGQGQSLEKALDEERATLDAIRREVSAGLHRLIPFLNHPAPDLRIAVIETLASFPEHRSWLLPALDSALASESDRDIRQALEEGKARLNKP